VGVRKSSVTATRIASEATETTDRYTKKRWKATNDYLEASREQPVLITRNGKPVAVLFAVRDRAEAEQLAVGRARSLRSIFEEAHEQIEKGGGIPPDQFWREVEHSRRAKRAVPSRSKKG
jgi:prevent-host-death family protein